MEKVIANDNSCQMTKSKTLTPDSPSNAKKKEIETILNGDFEDEIVLQEENGSSDYQLFHITDLKINVTYRTPCGNNFKRISHTKVKINDDFTYSFRSTTPSKSRFQKSEPKTPQSVLSPSEFDFENSSIFEKEVVKETPNRLNIDVNHCETDVSEDQERSFDLLTPDSLRRSMDYSLIRRDSHVDNIKAFANSRIISDVDEFPEEDAEEWLFSPRRGENRNNINFIESSSEEKAIRADSSEIKNKNIKIPNNKAITSMSDWEVSSNRKDDASSSHNQIENKENAIPKGVSNASPKPSPVAKKKRTHKTPSKNNVSPSGLSQSYIELPNLKKMNTNSWKLMKWRQEQQRSFRRLEASPKKDSLVGPNNSEKNCITSKSFDMSISTEDDSEENRKKTCKFSTSEDHILPPSLNRENTEQNIDADDTATKLTEHRTNDNISLSCYDIYCLSASITKETDLNLDNSIHIECRFYESNEAHKPFYIEKCSYSNIINTIDYADKIVFHILVGGREKYDAAQNKTSFYYQIDVNQLKLDRKFFSKNHINRIYSDEDVSLASVVAASQGTLLGASSSMKCSKSGSQSSIPSMAMSPKIEIRNSKDNGINVPSSPISTSTAVLSSSSIKQKDVNKQSHEDIGSKKKKNMKNCKIM